MKRSNRKGSQFAQEHKLTGNNPHQGKRECARRVRQMVNGTHGYSAIRFTVQP